MARPSVVFQLSDSHVGATWAGADPVARLEATVEAARRLPDRPDAVLFSGDLAENATPGEYAAVRSIVARLDAPVYPLPGNHDRRDALRASFELPGRTGTPVQYSADVGALRLVLLDSTRPGEDRGELDVERLAWLDAELTGAPDRPTLVALHHPPLLTGNAAWDELGLPVSDRMALGEVVSRHPQVERIVAGHLHRIISAGLGGRPVLAVPSTYAQAELDLTAAAIAFTDEPPAFAVHALADGALASYVQLVTG
jgi:3',5'-cyclic-AMP phosphodiesterase